VWRFQKWALFFVVIGANSILIYMAREFVDFGFTARFFFGGAIKNTGEYQELLSAIAVVFVEWLFLYVLYRRRIFLKV
jgi:predicted acyltransferase